MRFYKSHPDGVAFLMCKIKHQNSKECHLSLFPEFRPDRF